MAADRRLVKNRSGLTVAVDIGPDMDEATFDRLVEAGELEPVKSETKSTPKASSAKK
jgi:hypothetical protein